MPVGTTFRQLSGCSARSDNGTTGKKKKKKKCRVFHPPALKSDKSLALPLLVVYDVSSSELSGLPAIGTRCWERTRFRRNSTGIMRERGDGLQNILLETVLYLVWPVTLRLLWAAVEDLQGVFLCSAHLRETLPWLRATRNTVREAG